EADRLAAEPGLEPDEQDGGKGRPEDRRLAPVAGDGDGGEAEDEEPEDDGDGPVDPLEPDLVAGVEAWEELPLEAARPRRASQARIGRPDDDADRDEDERRQDGCSGELLVS